MITFLKKIGTILLKTILWFLAMSILSTVLFRFVPIPVTPLMLIRCGEQLVDKKMPSIKKDWVGIDKISKKVQLAVICSEDQHFLNHSGFDFDAIEKALKHNEKSKRKWGASTISQQTAKNVFLWPGRNWLRKGLEVYFTGLIELVWSKEKIMEVYLNIIEMGPAIYGIEKASQTYFKKPAASLTAAESALIAAILPNPIKWSVIKPTTYILRRKNFIEQQMINYGGTIIYQTQTEKKVK